MTGLQRSAGVRETPAEQSLQLALTSARGALHRIERMTNAMSEGSAVIAQRDESRARARETNEAVAAIGVGVVVSVVLAPLAIGSLAAEAVVGGVSGAAGSTVSQATVRGSINPTEVVIAAAAGAALVPIAHGAAHGIGHAVTAIRGSGHVVREVARESGMFVAEGGVLAAASVKVVVATTVPVESFTSAL